MSGALPVLCPGGDHGGDKGRVEVVDIEVLSVAQQASRQLCAHIAQTNESNRHLALLPLRPGAAFAGLR
jgi:hypothetical protein